MIARIWHGYSSGPNADTYEKLLKEEVLPGIEQRSIKGFKGIQLLRRELETETEFTTIMWFESMEAIIEFAGKDYETAHVPPEAQAVLSRFDSRSIHCELRYDIHYDPIDLNSN